MEYKQAIEKSWLDIEEVAAGRLFTVRLLTDNYSVDTNRMTVISDACNIPAKEHVIILILHYLEKRLRLGELPALTGEWIGFNQIEGGPGYYTAFKKRTIDPLIKKYNSHPAGFRKRVENIGGVVSGDRDIEAIFHPFDKTAVMIQVWAPDEEFGAGGQIVYDKNITDIFCFEDIVVLTEFIVQSI